MWTWSVGLTNATGHHVERYIGKPSSLQHAINVYVWALRRYAVGVQKAFRGVPITKAQFAAALSFHWNTGSILSATWVKQFISGDIEKARASIMNWKKPPEIEGRRKRERDLFFDGRWSGDGTITQFTRLTSKSTPDWKSGKKINVDAAIRGAFAAQEPVRDGAAIEPDGGVQNPTLSPTEGKRRSRLVPLIAFALVIGAIFLKLKGG